MRPDPTLTSQLGSETLRFISSFSPSDWFYFLLLTAIAPACFSDVGRAQDQSHAFKQCIPDTRY